MAHVKQSQLLQAITRCFSSGVETGRLQTFGAPGPRVRYRAPRVSAGEAVDIAGRARFNLTWGKVRHLTLNLGTVQGLILSGTPPPCRIL